MSSSPSRGRTPGRNTSPGRSNRTSPTKKFNEDDFDSAKKEREVLSPEQRKKIMAAKMRGVSLEPKDWTKTELLEKLRNFSKFEVNKKTGSSELYINENTKITNEIIAIINESCKRFTEINRMIINRCNLEDEHLTNLIQGGFVHLRHLKELYLASNQISSDGIDKLINFFPSLPRKLEILDLTDNSLLNSKDGLKLFKAFTNFSQIKAINNPPTGPYTITKINQLELLEYKLNVTQKELNLSNLNIHTLETGIIVEMLKYFHNVESLNLSNNRIDCKGFRQILNVIIESGCVKYLDISQNPNITLNGLDFSGINELLEFLQRKKQIIDVKLEGIKVPQYLLDNIQRSLYVNHAIENDRDPYTFNKFLRDLIVSKAPNHNYYPYVTPPTLVKKGNMNNVPQLNPVLTIDTIVKQEINESFIRYNALPIVHMETTDNDYHLNWKIDYEFLDSLKDD